MLQLRNEPLTFTALDSLPYIGGSYSGCAMALDDAGVASGQTFLEGQLEYQERELYKPLTSVTWDRDMPVKTGGGFVSNTSNYFINYATPGGNQYGLVNGQTDNVPIIQANITKDINPVFPWASIIKVPLMDQDRLSQAGLGESLDQIFNQGLKLNYNKTLDQLVYFGFPNVNVTGLVNNPNVSAANVANGAAGTKAWNTKTPTEIMTDVNTAINNAWAASNYDPEGMPNHILIDPANFSYINNTLISTAGSQSILSYLLQNNMAKALGRNLVILPARQCIGAGASATNRMVAYVNDVNKIHFNITVPLYRKMTQPNVLQDAYLTRYESFLGVVKFLYYMCASYSDGI